MAVPGTVVYGGKVQLCIPAIITPFAATLPLNLNG